jgi:hypothetical protein
MSLSKLISNNFEYEAHQHQRVNDYQNQNTDSNNDPSQCYDNQWVNNSLNSEEEVSEDFKLDDQRGKGDPSQHFLPNTHFSCVNVLTLR